MVKALPKRICQPTGRCLTVAIRGIRRLLPLMLGTSFLVTACADEGQSPADFQSKLTIALFTDNSLLQETAPPPSIILRQVRLLSSNNPRSANVRPAGATSATGALTLFNGERSLDLTAPSSATLFENIAVNPDDNYSIIELAFLIPNDSSGKPITAISTQSADQRDGAVFQSPPGEEIRLQIELSPNTIRFADGIHDGASGTLHILLAPTRLHAQTLEVQTAHYFAFHPPIRGVSEGAIERTITETPSAER